MDITDFSFKKSFIFDRSAVSSILYANTELFDYICDLQADIFMRDMCCSFSVFEQDYKLDSILAELYETKRPNPSTLTNITYLLYDTQSKIEEYVLSFVRDPDCSFCLTDWTDMKDPIITVPDYSPMPKIYDLRRPI